MKQLFITLFLFSSVSLFSQDDCPCCNEYNKQFDFWIGEWVVYDTAGNIVGENTIKKVERGCLLTEEWKGSKGGTGRSINFFDRTDSTWNQTWVDNSGNTLILKGNLIDNSMVLQSELIEGTRVDFYKNRITWTPENDKSVTQKWEILDKNDNLLQLLFLGIYKTKNHEN